MYIKSFVWSRNFHSLRVFWIMYQYSLESRAVLFIFTIMCFASNYIVMVQLTYRFKKLSSDMKVSSIFTNIVHLSFCISRNLFCCFLGIVCSLESEKTWNLSTFQDKWCFFRTFQDIPSFSSTFQDKRCFLGLFFKTALHFQVLFKF